MSKIDTLLSLVDDLSAKSDTLVSSICESNTLISLILELNSSITAADAEIDTMTELINKNNVCLNEFEKLYEKSFFLESNLHLNQRYTNETSLDNLNKECSYLLSSFGHYNVRHFAEEVEPPAENKTLKNMLSISNLELKPIRCRSTKLSKPKSRYRLSSAYTLNPVQESPSRNYLKSSHDTNTSSMMEHNTNTSFATTVSDHYRNQSIYEEAGKSYDGFYASERIGDNFKDGVENYKDGVENYTQHEPEHGNSYNSQIKHSSEKDPNTMKSEFELSPEKSLKLFTFGAMSPVHLDTLNSDDFDESQFSNSDCSPLSDIDFSLFLRQSRVDLRTAFPAPIQKSQSHDSVFATAIPPPPPKFHNPALMLTHAKESVVQPTVEAIYSNSYNSTSFEMAGSNFREHSKKLLHNVPPDLPESPTKQKPVTPRRKSNFTLFNLLNSPIGSPSGMQIHAEERRGSIDVSKSFVGLLNLVGNKPHVPTTHRGEHRSPPEKIKKLKKGIQEPIAIKSDVHNKRLPPSERELSGSHSSLAIGPGKQKIINHGESSIFRKPPVRNFNRQLMTSAPNDSILF